MKDSAPGSLSVVARALGTQAINRLAELETLRALPAPDDEQRRRIERLALARLRGT